MKSPSVMTPKYSTLQWCHNERNGVSNHWHLDCLLNCLFRCRSKKTQSSVSLAFVRGIHQWPVNSPHKGPVRRKMLPFDKVIMMKKTVNYMYFPSIESGYYQSSVCIIGKCVSSYWFLYKWWVYINGSVQNCSIFSALAIEILQSCTKPSVPS